MQLAVVDFARNVLGIKDAHSTEFDEETKLPVICKMDEQKDIEDLGGSLRLGVYPCKLQENTLAKEIYHEEIIYERHRHRFEFNNEYRKNMMDHGLVISGLSPDESLVEIVELKDHPWFIGVQFHPEFKSRPTRSHPLFKAFIEAACK